MSAEPMMTRNEIEAVFERVKTWPPERQAYAAFLLRQVEQDESGVLELTDEEVEELDRAEASGVAPNADVEALLRPYR